MRKSYITALAVVGVILFALTPPAKGQSLKMGAKGGYNVSTVALDYTEIYDFRGGYNAGIFAEYTFGNLPLSVALEGYYMEYGANNIDPGLIYYEDSPLLDMPMETSHFRFRSFEVPLLVKYHLPFLESISPGIYLGSSFNIIRQADNLNEFEDNQLSAAEIDQRIMNYDISGIAGLSTEIDIAPFALTFDVRYRMGIRDLNNVSGYPEFTAQSWQFMAGFAYDLGFVSGGG